MSESAHPDAEDHRDQRHRARRPSKQERRKGSHVAYWLDDGFDSWPEVVRAGSPAVGLYVRCGAWIARNTHDGLVPGEVAGMYGTPEWARRLVDVGLWSIEEAGYRDVRYFEMGNPTREQVVARRKADADRKARWRAKKEEAGKSRRDSTRDSGVRPAVGHGVDPLFPSLPPLKGEGARAREAPKAHTFVEGDGGWCKDCGLPSINKVHPRGRAA